MEFEYDGGLTNQHTWIGRLLASGNQGRTDVWKRVVEAYYDPLVEFARERFRRADVDQLVNDYLTNALERKSWLEAWTPERSRLGIWLFHGLTFYVRSQRTNETRRRQTIAWDEAMSAVPDTFAVWETRINRQIVEAAIENTGDEIGSSDEGRIQWEMFKAHWLRGTPYRDLAAHFDTSAKKVEWKCRAVRDRLKDNLRTMMRRDGVAESDVDGELRRLLADLR